MTEDIGWGILATGRIAHTFARDLALVPGARLAAVGSRSSRARRGVRASEHGAAAAYGSYEELVADPAVDVVYVATPHALHLEHARLALEAGKHVLCEKPLTLDAAEAEEMVRAGPAARPVPDGGDVDGLPPGGPRGCGRGCARASSGRPRHLHAELGFGSTPAPTTGCSTPRSAPGALLDMGIYPLTFAHLLLGEAEELTRDRRPVRPRHRPRRRDRRPLPRRRARDDDRVDDVVVLADGRDRHRPRPDRRSTTSTTRRRPSFTPYAAGEGSEVDEPRRAGARRWATSR